MKLKSDPIINSLSLVAEFECQKVAWAFLSVQTPVIPEFETPVSTFCHERVTFVPERQSELSDPFCPDEVNMK
jgi:hypothetical protein